MPTHPKTAYELPLIIHPLRSKRTKSNSKSRRNLQPYYPSLVEYIFRSRFCTAYQLRRRFNRHLKSDRSTHRHLANLTEWGYINIAPVRSTSPNFPHVYHASAAGIRYVEDAYASRGIVWQAPDTERIRGVGQSQDTILHELLITEFELGVWKTISGRSDLHLAMTERRYFRREKRLLDEKKKRQLVPDAGFLLAAKIPGRSHPGFLNYFIEVDNGTENATKILDKFRTYDEWSRSDSGKTYLEKLYRQFGSHDPKPNFRVLIIAHDKLHPGKDLRRLVDLFTQALQIDHRTRERFLFTTVAQLKDHQNDSSPLGASIWIHPGDARPWLKQFAQLPKKWGDQTASRIRAAQRKFVMERIGDLPLRPVFPDPKT